jgi:hypothetical protein
MAKIWIEQEIVENLMAIVDGEYGVSQNEANRGKGAFETDTYWAAKDVIGAAQPPEQPVRYCYSFDEERFAGPYDSEQVALQTAAGDMDRDGNSCVFLGEVEDARDLLGAGGLGDHIVDAITEDLEEEIGEAAEFFAATDAQKEALGEMVIDYVDKVIGLECFRAINVRVVALPAEVVASE